MEVLECSRKSHIAWHSFDKACVAGGDKEGFSWVLSIYEQMSHAFSLPGPLPSWGQLLLWVPETLSHGGVTLRSTC